jgi:hypothetical protein
MISDRLQKSHIVSRHTGAMLILCLGVYVGGNSDDDDGRGGDVLRGEEGRGTEGAAM